jgi:Flp pilus assembly protein CpaB
MATTGEVAQTRQLAATPVVEAARAQRAGLGSRLSAGHVVMIVAGILAFVATAGVLRSRDATVPVAVAARDIPPGAVVDRGAVRSVPLSQKSPLVAAVLGPTALDGQHMVAARLIRAGEPLRRSDVRTGAGDGLRAMSVSVNRDHAAGGELVVGDRVDVIQASPTGATYVVRDAEVLAVPPKGNNSGLGLGNGASNYYVTVAVDGDAALRLAAAIQGGKVEVLRSNGAAPPSRPSYSASSPGT